MTTTRRLASLAVIAVAGAATIATSPGTPSPPPGIDEALSGTVELSAERPVAVREIVVRVTGLDPTATSGRVASVMFRPTANGLRPAAGAGELWTSVVRAEPAEPGEPRFESGTFRSLVDWQAAPPSLDLTCAEGACEGRFALIVDLVNRTMAEPVNIDWNVAAHVELWSGLPAGSQPAVEVTVDETAPAAAVTSAELSDETATLDLTNRLAMWRLAMTLGDEAVARPAWPIVVTARLRPTATAKEIPDGGMRGPNIFIEGAGDRYNVGLDPWRPDDTIEFEPFWACAAGERCTADYVVGVDLRSVHQDVAVEAGWELDVRAIAADGRTMPLNVVAEPIPAMPMISTTVGGTVVIGPDGDKPPVRYTVTERPGVAGRDLQWDGLRLPTYGILRARATSTGVVELPTRGLVARFGPRDFRFGLTLGEDGVFAFIPGGPQCRVPDCDLAQVFSGGVGADIDELGPGTEVTIEWELEVGMGTDVTDGDSALLMEVVQIASPSP
jgi:hypothetical protein